MMGKKLLMGPLVALVLCGCHKTATNQEGGTYKTQVVRKESRTLRSEYTARLQGQQVVEVRPQVSGLITQICIGEGQEVRRGQLLFVIDQVPYRAALASAEASVKNAEAALATARLNMENTQMLYDRNVVGEYDLSSTRNALAAAEAQLAVARAQETSARNDLSYTEVRSPVEGVAGMIAYRVGSLVGSSISEPLVTVSDDSRMFAYFSLTESQVLNLMEQYGPLDGFISQMPDVELRMSNGKTYAERGRVAAVSGIVTEGTGAVTLRADFPNTKRLLRGGGSATVIVPSELDSCIAIPQSATYELQGKTFAYKVAGGKARSVPISVYRLDNGTEYVVTDGLQEGDTIIAEGAGLVKEGAAVAN